LCLFNIRGFFLVLGALVCGFWCGGGGGVPYYVL
jgi:hypothetical protein